MFKLIVRTVFSFTVLITLCLPAAAEENNKLKAGMLLTLSGNFSSAGEDCRQGIEAAISISKRADAFDLIYADSKNEPSTAIGEFRRLTSINGTQAIYTHRSSIGMPLNPISEQAKIPLLGAAGHKDFAINNKYAFQVWPRSDHEGEFMAKKYIDLGYKKIALIYTDDEWTGAIAEGFRETYSKLGGEIVFDQSVLLSSTDFRTLLLKVKQKSPDAVYMNVLLPQIGPMIKQARNIKLPGEYFANFYVSRDDVINSAGVDALEGVKYLEMETNLPALKTALKMPQDSSPAGLTVASYVATMLLSQAIPEDTTTINSEIIYTELLKQTEVRTPDHVYPIKDRVVEFPLIMKVIRNGKGTLFSGS